MSQGQTGEISLPSPGKLGHFLILGLFSTRPSQKLGTPTHLETTFSNRYGTGLSSQKDRLDKLKITVLTSNCKKTVLNYVLCKKAIKKHLVIEWLPCRQNKRYLINFTFYETFKNAPIPHKNLTFLHQRSHQIVGIVGPTPSRHPMWFQNP